MKPKDLLDKQMTRKEFLKVMGLGLLAVFGVNNLIAQLLKSGQQSQTAQVGKVPTTHGFGSSRFGR